MLPLDNTFLQSSTVCDSYTIYVPSSAIIFDSLEEGVVIMLYRGWAFFSLSLSAPWPGMGLCINHHLLQIKAREIHFYVAIISD